MTSVVIGFPNPRTGSSPTIGWLYDLPRVRLRILYLVQLGGAPPGDGNGFIFPCLKPSFQMTEITLGGAVLL